jgi:hypothetical protein
MTPQDFIASFGGDWRRNIEEFKAFFEACKKDGVVLDIDVAHVDQHGRQPTKAKDGTELEEGDPELDNAPKSDDEDDDDDKEAA